MKSLFILLVFGVISTIAVVEQARSTNDFIDSICVCTHLGYTDTKYSSNYTQIKQRLKDAGIRFVRDSLHERLHDLARSGIKSVVLADPDPNGGHASLFKDKVKAFNAVHPSIAAVEGPNEPDLFWARWHPNGYMGQDFPEGAVKFMKDLYTSLKSDSATRNLTVIGIALGSTITYDHPNNPLGNEGELEDYVDWGNFHPYPGGNAFNYPYSYAGIAKYYHTSNFPSIALDEHPINFVMYTKPYGDKPMAATETGYSTTTSSTTRRAAGKYIPRLYLEYFRLGIKRTCTYEFIDEWNNPGDRESNFGMLDYFLNPKPSYTAVKNLISLLQDNKNPTKMVSLDYDISYSPPANYTRTNFIHHLILQKSDNSVFFIIWHEISNMDTATNPDRELVHPNIPATLTINTPLTSSKATIHSFNDLGQVSSQTQDLPVLSLQIPDRPLVIELSGSSASSTVKCASADEHKNVKLECSVGVIDVKSAHYGTPNWCPNISAGSCDSDSALSFVRSQCNRKQSCTFGATNANFGDPCVGTFKRSVVSYSCL